MEVLEAKGVTVGGYRMLGAESSSVPNAIAAFLLYVRDKAGRVPHCYSGRTEDTPVVYLLRYLLFGEVDTAPVAHEVLREAGPDPARRPPSSTPPVTLRYVRAPCRFLPATSVALFGRRRRL